MLAGYTSEAFVDYDRPMPIDSVLPPPPPTPPHADVRPPAPFRFRPTAVVAWGVILIVCITLPLLQAERKREATTRPAGPGVVDFQTRLMGRYVVGMSKLPSGATDVENNVVAAPSPTVEGRIATAITLGELRGREAAIERLQKIDDPDARTFAVHYQLSEPDAAAAKIEADAARSASSQKLRVETATTRSSTGPSADDLNVLTTSELVAGYVSGQPDLGPLRPRFGWFVDLAESHGKPDSNPQRAAVLGAARRTVYAVVAAAGVIGLAAVVGFGLFVTAIVLLAMGKLRFAVGRPVGPGHVYAEAFAIYLAGFVGMSLAIGLLLPGATFAVQILGLCFVVIVAAIWPLLRGVRWADLKTDWGIHAGRNPVVEVLAGVGGYLAGLPIVFAGVGLTVWLMRYFQAEASHPITQGVGVGPVWVLYLIAAVFAPLSEELLFRGALVSHLRAGVGIVLAAVISGVVFAAVHPQGWAAIPALGSIGVVLALIRQWRGSLIASVTAHAVNNGFVITLLVLATR